MSIGDRALVGSVDVGLPQGRQYQRFSYSIERSYWITPRNDG